MALSRAASNSGRSSSRYRDLSTPVIRLFAPFQYDRRDYGQEASQPALPDKNRERQSEVVQGSPPSDVNRSSHMKVQAPAPDPTTLPSIEWTPEENTDIHHGDVSPSPSSLATQHMIRRKLYERRQVSKKSLVEQPRLQDDDTTDALGLQATPINTDRFDWRATATSQLSVARREEQLRNRRPFRYKIQPSEEEPENAFLEGMHSYLDKFEPLVNQEQLASDSVLNDRITTWPLKRLEEEGFCISQLSIVWQEATQFGRPVAVLSLGPGKKFELHRFEAGDQVRISNVEEGPLRDGHRSGAVVRVTETEISVAFSHEFDTLFAHLRMDLWTSDIAAQRMIDAMKSFRFNPLDQTNLNVEKSVWRESILQGTELRDVLLHAFRASSGENAPQPIKTFDAPGAFDENQLIASWVRRYRSSSPVLMPGDPIISLNESQVKALALMIGSRISLIQGPPGTGKTRTIATAVKLLKSHFKIPHPTLVCTYTNVAVDNLVETLVSEGLSPLRVGSVGKIKENITPYSLEARMNAHELAPELAKVEIKLEELATRKMTVMRLMDTTKGDEALKTVTRILDQAIEAEATMAKVMYKLRTQMLTDIVLSADVICTTCITAASSALNVVDFPIVFLDEASMCTEPASIIPIMKGCRHLALIGDHKQLPPIITSPEALAGGLGVSLFERLISEGGVPSVMLDRQYRMHPQIAAFPAREFYAGMLRDGTLRAGEDRGKSQPALKSSYLKNADNSCVVFLNHTGGETRRDRSRANEHEASIVCDVVEDILKQNPDLTGDSIGIIAPYAAQIALLDRLLRNDSAFHDRLAASIGQCRALETASIEVKTVDGFEGREKEVIIFSTVRNNTAGYTGFLADRRRLNVGLTRAQRALFVLGNARTLKLGKVGYVEAAIADAGVGLKNVKVDVGIDVAGQSEKDPSLFDTNSRSMQQKDGVWKRYLGWLAERGLIVDLGPASKAQQAKAT